MRDPTRRMHEHAPCTASGAGAPRERRVLVREAGVDAERVLDLRMDELTALVERTELLAETVHRLAGSERERSRPFAALTDAAERRQAREAAKMLVGDRARDRRASPQQAEPQRTARHFERCLAGGKAGDAGFRLRYRARLRAADEDAVVGPRVRADPHAEHAGTEAGHLENVARGRRERSAGRRRVDRARVLEAQIVGRIEVQEHRRIFGSSRRNAARASPARRRASRRCRRIAAGARAPRRCAAGARW